jgi:hypothetical protein
MRTNRIGWIFVVSMLFVVGCGDDDGRAGSGGSAGSSSGSGGTGGTSGSGGTGATDGVDAGVFPINDAGQVQCGTGACACHNGIDDDNDGLIDGADVECTGPYDDDEGTFATGIPGDNVDSCQDCFFDGNSGQGNDGCAYPTECLYGEDPGPSGSDCKDCEVSDRCVNFCRARTPNGCDCFGCCGVLTETGETVNVVLAATCSLDVVDDEAKCPRCVPTTNDCINECGRCELCPGKTVADLPSDCYAPPGDAAVPDAGGPVYPPQTCDEGYTACDDTHPCPNNFWCQLGCCMQILF